MTTQTLTDRTPAPSLELDLLDGDRVVGWITGDTVGFRGFADETHAAHAAWVAHRALARRLARRRGARPVPIDTEPLALQRRGDREVILASGAPIATLVRPGADSRSGTDSFGFEIQIPLQPDELTMQSTAYFLYRTLRKSGIRWAPWQPRGATTPVTSPAGSPPADQVARTAAEPAAANGKVGEARMHGDGEGNRNTHTGGSDNVTSRRGRRSRWFPSLPWRRTGRLDRRRRDRVSRL